MAAIRSEDLLGWYVITLKLRETVESGLPKKSIHGSKIIPDYDPRTSMSEWVISIKEKLAQGRRENMPGSWAKLSIYWIPRHLKHGEDKAWVPQIVSLGPYHHGEEHLRHMERHKWRCLDRILERSRKGIDLYLDSVRKVEQRARACYEGRISMSCDEFVEMMVLDGCFVIEMFLGFAEGFEKLGYLPYDPVFSMRESILQIQRDMIMLENQIPLFILNRLLGLQLGDPNQKERMAELALQFFSPSSGSFPPSNYFNKNLGFHPLCILGKVHCLEVVQRSLRHLGWKQPKTKKWSQSQKRLTFCLSELREAGIQIKRRSGNGWGDIHFKNGILEIPSIEIHEGTRSLFLNLIAFEQSHFNCSHDVTSYVIFMHNLMNSPEDVLHLCNCRIIEHCLGKDAEVVDLFHWLCQEVAFDRNDGYLSEISKDLAMYRFGLFPLIRDRVFSDSCLAKIRSGLALLWVFLRAFFTGKWRASLALLWVFLGAFLTRKWRAFLTRKWYGWKAILEDRYFDSPWSIISLIAAIALFVLTFIQAYYAVYAYHRPSS